MIFRVITQFLIDAIFVLLVAFVCLRLAGEIDWSWYLVLSPLWIGALVYGALAAIGRFL